MKNPEAAKARYLAMPYSHQLGELAAALSLFASVAAPHAERPDITRHLFNEPLCYAEWLIPEVNPQLQAEITEIHTCLQAWERDWFQINANEIQRHTVIKQVREWSDRMLDASGLVEERLREVA